MVKNNEFAFTLFNTPLNCDKTLCMIVTNETNGYWHDEHNLQYDVLCSYFCMDTYAGECDVECICDCGCGTQDECDCGCTSEYTYRLSSEFSNNKFTNLSTTNTHDLDLYDFDKIVIVREFTDVALPILKELIIFENHFEIKTIGHDEFLNLK